MTPARDAAYCHVHGYTDCGCVCACEPPSDMGEDSLTGADIPEPVGAGSRPVPPAANAYGMVDGSPQEFCNDEQPHDPHEYLVGMRRFQCPGLPFGGPTVANMNERGAGSGASPECASNSDSRADHLSSATPPASHAAWKPDRRFWPFWTWFEVMRWAAQRGGHRG